MLGLKELHDKYHSKSELYENGCCLCDSIIDLHDIINNGLNCTIVSDEEAILGFIKYIRGEDVN